MVLHFAAACCNTINVILAWIAFLLPAIATKSDDRKPYYVIGIWSTCSTGTQGSDQTDDYKCLGWNDPRGGASGSYQDGDKTFFNVGLLYKYKNGNYSNTPNHISITMGLYTTAIVLLSLGAYTSCAAIGMKKLSLVSAICNWLAGCFFLAVAIFMFGTQRFGVSDCICNKVNGVGMVCGTSGQTANTGGEGAGGANICLGWNYTAIYTWIAWQLCWWSSGLSRQYGASDDKPKEDTHTPEPESEGATTGKI